MAVTVHLDIASPEGHIFSGLAEMISVTGEMGELGIMPGHAQLLSAIKPGQVRVKLQGGKTDIYYISGGTLEVQPNLITILADTVDRAENLDEAEAIKAKESAEKLLTERKHDEDYTRTLIELAQAAAKLRAIREMRKYRK
ncbi:MAG: F0F1 ATP synthase subunit epsilon [Gammaproteobacteria bacterium]|nr:F0F1 ATP synthase subunit epsilon [Gammaproteobacteria bacterium]